MNATFKNGNRKVTLNATEFRHVGAAADSIRELPGMLAESHPLAPGAKAATEFLTALLKNGPEIDLNAKAT